MAAGRPLSPPDPDSETTTTASSDGSSSGEDDAVAGEDGVGSPSPRAKRRLLDADGADAAVAAARPDRRRSIAALDEITQACTDETTSESTSSSSETNPVIVALNSLWLKMRELNAIKESKKDERYEKLFLLQKQRLELEKEQLELEKNIVERKRMELELQIKGREERIMNMDLSGMTMVQKNTTRSCRLRS